MNRKSIFVTVIFFLVLVPALIANAARYEDFDVTKLRIRGTAVTSTAAELNKLHGVTGTLISSTSTVIRSIPLPVLGFALSDGNLLARTMSRVGFYITPSTSYVPSLVFPEKSSPVTSDFRVPDNYSSGGYFKLMAYQSGNSGLCRVGFDYRVNSNGSALATTATTQPEFALAHAGPTPTQVVLTPTMALVAGQIVNLRLWLGATSTGTDTLHVFDTTFIYTSTP